MVEVYPNHVRSHVEPDGTPFFGPHLHLGDERLDQISKVIIDRVGNTFSQRWVERFRRHATTSDNGENRLLGPMGENLFA